MSENSFINIAIISILIIIIIIIITVIFLFYYKKYSFAQIKNIITDFINKITQNFFPNKNITPPQIQTQPLQQQTPRQQTQPSQQQTQQQMPQIPQVPQVQLTQPSIKLPPQDPNKIFYDDKIVFKLSLDDDKKLCLKVDNIKVKNETKYVTYTSPEGYLLGKSVDETNILPTPISLSKCENIEQQLFIYDPHSSDKSKIFAVYASPYNRWLYLCVDNDGVNIREYKNINDDCSFVPLFAYNDAVALGTKSGYCIDKNSNGELISSKCDITNKDNLITLPRFKKL